MHGPRVVGLIRLAIVFGEAVAVPVGGSEPSQYRIDGREHFADQGLAVRSGRNGVAPGLEDELRSEVLPAVDVLEPVPVRPMERVVAGPAHVVRHRAGELARGVATGCRDVDEGRVVDGDRRQQVADPAQLKVREQLEHREGRVEVHIDGVVEGATDAQHRETPDVVRAGERTPTSSPPPRTCRRRRGSRAR